MPTFADDETGVQSSRPRDAYEFILPAVTYRLTSGVKDLVVNGQTYHPAVIGRGSLKPSVADGSPGELEISLIATHPIVRSCLQLVAPTVDVNIYRQQLTSGEYEFAWSGRVAEAKCERNSATLLVVQRIDTALTRRIPTITVGRECAHVLYDSRCTVNRNLFRVDTTVSLVDGRDVTVASIGGKPDRWADFGEFVHVPSGIRITITNQTGTAIETHLPIAMQSGDAVQIFAGCDHDIATCHDKFANQVNFGGFPHLPKTNPFVANGYGIYESE